MPATLISLMVLVAPQFLNKHLDPSSKGDRGSTVQDRFTIRG
jgi:hypothetical protein